MPSRLVTTAGLVLALACLSAPLALADAGGAPPLDGTGYDGRSPDTKDAAAAAHQNQRNIANSKLVITAGPPMNGVGYDGRSPDTKDATAAAHQNQRGVSTAKAVVATTKAVTTAGPPLNGAGYDGRSPDTKDATLANSPAPVIVAATNGFNWTDAGIGSAAGFGLAIMLAAGLTLRRKETTITAS